MLMGKSIQRIKNTDASAFHVLATIADSVDDERFDVLLQDVRLKFRRQRKAEPVSYFVHRTAPRALEFSCDEQERQAVCAWLRLRAEVCAVRIDPLD
jgi:hypothetical protein